MEEECCHQVGAAPLIHLTLAMIRLLIRLGRLNEKLDFLIEIMAEFSLLSPEQPLKGQRCRG